MNVKKCSKCSEIKPTSEFYRQANWWTAWCKECLKESSRQRVADGRDKESKLRYEIKNNHVRQGRHKLTELERIASETYHNIKTRTLQKMPDKQFDVTKDWLVQEISKFCENNHHDLSFRSPFKPSVDRIDNSKGYTKDNIKIMWLIENYCKNNFTDEQVVEFCKRKLGLL